MCFAGGTLKVHMIYWNARNKLYDGVPHWNNAKEYNKVSFNYIYFGSMPLFSHLVTFHLSSSSLLPYFPFSVFFLPVPKDEGKKRKWCNGEKRMARNHEEEKERKKERKEPWHKKKREWGKKKWKITRGVDKEGEGNKWGKWGWEKEIGEDRNRAYSVNKCRLK